MCGDHKVANDGYTGAQWTLYNLNMNVNLSTITVTVALMMAATVTEVVWKGDC